MARDARRTGNLVPRSHGSQSGNVSNSGCTTWTLSTASRSRSSKACSAAPKADSVELPDLEKPPTAHVARVETTVAGSELEIFRRSVPYGSAGEQGLYFVAFSAERSRFDTMLSRMFGTAPDGIHDRLTDFSRPVTGAYYFAPSQTLLNELAGTG